MVIPTPSPSPLRREGNKGERIWEVVAIDIRDRVIRVERVRLGDLIPNPKNWKNHPQYQREALASLLEDVGFAGAVVVRETPDGLMLLDGHMRTDEYPDIEAYALVTDITADEEDRFLVEFDPIAQLAEANRAKLAALHERVAQRSEDISKAMAEVRERQKSMNWESLDTSTFLTKADVPDALWPTDNDYEIPVLDLTMQADAVDLPVEIWGASKRKRRMNGTWLFYTTDDRFEALWTDPTPVVNTGCVTVAEPNFSTNHQMPFPVALWGIYRKRWLGRYWQSVGKRLLVDLNVNEKYFDLNMFGIPAGWRAYATRGHSDLIPQIRHLCEMAKARAESDSILFVVYGGGKALHAEARAHGWIWIPEQQDVAKGRFEPYGGE